MNRGLVAVLVAMAMTLAARAAFAQTPALGVTQRGRHLSGWALDRGVPLGTRIDGVHVWAYPFGTGGVFGY